MLLFCQRAQRQLLVVRVVLDQQDDLRHGRFRLDELCRCPRHGSVK